MTDLQSFDRPLVMIGCGNMAGAMLSRWLECGLAASRVTVVDPGVAVTPEGVTLVRDLPDALPRDAVVVMGIKPQLLPDLAPRLAPLLGEGHLVISMLAGVTVARLDEALGDGASIVRIMPNTPVALGQGVCALYTDPHTGKAARVDAQALLSPLGVAEWIAQEEALNLVTALTGCGPAFVYRFIDAMAQAASALGMDAAQAQRFAIATVQGSANLAAGAGETPAELAERVASKGGMTREGLDVLDADERFVRLMTDTLRAARDRGEELNRLSA